MIGVVLMLMTVENQIQKQTQKKDLDFNKFVANELKTQKNDQMRVAVSLARS